jgi:hypothetical protein
VHISSSGVLTVEARAWDGSSVQVTYNPDTTQSTQSPFTVNARVGSRSVSNSFLNSDFDGTIINPLGAGANARSGAVAVYGDARALPRVDALQVFTLRPAAGAPQFEYVRLLQYAYVADPFSSTSEVLGTYTLYGFPTDAINMPAAGAASWQGVGTGSYNGPIDSYDFLGDASMTANFATGTVTGSMSNFIYADGGASLITTANGINSFAFTGTISGSAFAGSATVDFAASPDLTADLRGQFYGPPTGAPVEAGGVFAGEDATQTIYGGFVAGPAP